ncbi:MAG: ribonuclease HI [Clostridia bacterium]|nr:ribonuclease HI [Clostridia bacterium]
MNDCIFCKIIAGEMPCHKIYEDDFVLAFLDIANDIYGHTLVIPKKHYVSVKTCDSTTLARVIDACKKVGNHYLECGFDGYNILNATGEAAQQSVFHLHFHILPRKKGDGENAFPTLSGCKEDLSDVCKALKFEEEKKQTICDENCVVLYTDGACSGNPGAGGWAAISSYKGQERVLSGGEEMTTNNRMELMAVINGLESVEEDVPVKVFSDSAYVVNAFLQNWIGSWKKNNWRTAGGSEVLNKELWQRLLKAMETRDVEFNKVKGHSDNEYNNRCDALAREEIAKLN